MRNKSVSNPDWIADNFLHILEDHGFLCDALHHVSFKNMDIVIQKDLLDMLQWIKRVMPDE